MIIYSNIVAMDMVGRHIALTAWGCLYGFGKSTTSRRHRAGKLPPELPMEQLPNGALPYGGASGQRRAWCGVRAGFVRGPAG